MGAALVVGGSVGEDLNASLNRVRGTLAGAVVGTALAYALGMSVWSLGIAVALLAWLSIGLGWGTAALRVGIAMALVVLFTHTSDAAQYGVWRVLNTLIGVCIGIAVSRLVWPIRGRDEVAGAIDRALAATRRHSMRWRAAPRPTRCCRCRCRCSIRSPRSERPDERAPGAAA